jgi:hypothetical protein
MQGWNAFGSASLLPSGYGLQDSSLSRKEGGGGGGNCSKVRCENMRNIARLQSEGAIRRPQHRQAVFRSGMHQPATNASRIHYSDQYLTVVPGTVQLA